LNPVSEVEIKQIINKLKGKLTSGIDRVSEMVVKRSAEYIIKPLTNTCIASFEVGIFPDKLKMVVKPIYKKGNREDIENYRPISLLPVFSKIIERVINVRLTNFITNNDILVEARNGFRKGKSMETAIQAFLENIYVTLEKKISTVGIILDLSKAYDVIYHKILLDKLEAYGIREVVNQWFESYETGRRQCVEIKYIGNKKNFRKC
jgi:hypothetical protein